MRIHSNGNVGINTRLPTGILDISSTAIAENIVVTNYTNQTGGGRILQGLMPNLPTNGQTSLFLGQALTASNYGAIRYGHNGGTGSASNYMSLTPSDATKGLFVRQDGSVDVSSGITVASVNMTSWSRKPVNNFFWVRGLCNANVSTWRLRWNTTNTNAVNTNILDWQDNATHGSYFRVLKTGIWSINYTYSSTSAGAFTWIDVSSSFSNGHQFPTTAGAGQLIALGGADNTSTQQLLSFTGYLESNTAQFYRFSASASTGTLASNVRPYLNINFLYETPAIAGGLFPLG
jgi:hypothetical protein